MFEFKKIKYYISITIKYITIKNKLKYSTIVQSLQRRAQINKVCLPT